MRVLMMSSEISPFAKTGGLADVAGALPQALAQRGHDVRLIMPLYQSVDRFKHRLLPLSRRLYADWGNERINAELMRCSYPCQYNIPTYFLQQHMLFGRKGLYGENHRDYPDNDRRFAFFNLAVLYAIKALDWCPDVIHLNDWQTGLVPLLLRYHPYIANDPFYQGIKTVFTIHNLAYQGLVFRDLVSRMQLPWSVFTHNGLEFYEQASLLKSGIVFSDHVTTVSPTYAQEIQTEELGGGLEGVLQDRMNDLTGILNGIDVRAWDPKSDPLIPANFSAENLSGKKTCREHLLAKLEINCKPKRPLIGMISRLAEQKGISLIMEALPPLLEKGCGFIVLGNGEKEAEEFFLKLAKKYPKQVSANITYNENLAHEIEAGADIFLMPSRFEPCGLNQLYSMRYGTIPVVHQTGGLADSVVDYTAASLKKKTATGFSFNEYTPNQLQRTLERAVAVFEKEPEVWAQLMQNAMNLDSSWVKSAISYEDVYSKVLNNPRHSIL